MAKTTPSIHSEPVWMGITLHTERMAVVSDALLTKMIIVLHLWSGLETKLFRVGSDISHVKKIIWIQFGQKIRTEHLGLKSECGHGHAHICTSNDLLSLQFDEWLNVNPQGLRALCYVMSPRDVVCTIIKDCSVTMPGMRLNNTRVRKDNYTGFVAS